MQNSRSKCNSINVKLKKILCQIQVLDTVEKDSPIQSSANVERKESLEYANI